MKILFIGDIVGSLGRKAAKKHVAQLRKKHGLDFVIANAENAAHGSGVSENVLNELLDAKIDFFTSGDHVFKNKKHFDIFDKFPLIRPANYPEGVPGLGYSIIEISGKKLAIINLIGRVFMHFDYDCPFRKIDEILANINLQEKDICAIIVDIHAEASSEKVCFKHYVNGRVSAVFGTHTHVQTADAEISNQGTAYITDAGMTGFADGSLGLAEKELIETFLTQIKEKHVVPEKGRTILSGAIVELSDRTGKAKSIKIVREFAEFE